MKKLIAVLGILPVFICLQGQKFYADMSLSEQRLFDEHVIEGQPDTEKGAVYIRHGYVAKYNTVYKIPDWVSYHLILDYLNTPKREGRYKSFRNDPDMDDPVKTKHYTGTSYARGHMAPYFAMGGDRDDNGRYADRFDNAVDPYDDTTVFQANYMSNIAPQDHSALNGSGGPWYALETAIRKKLVIKEKMELNIVVGGIICNPDDYKTLEGDYEDVSIAIPENYFQVIIYKKEDGEYITAGFLFEHVREKKDLPYDDLIDYLVPVDSIELLTGFDFLNEKSEDQQNETERVDNKAFWVSKGL